MGMSALFCCLQGVLCRTLEGHAHWVNTLALNTDYAMRTATVDFNRTGIIILNKIQPYGLQLFYIQVFQESMSCRN